MFDRASVIDKAFADRLRRGHLPQAVSTTSIAQAGLSPEQFLHLFESQLISRQLDLFARRSKGKTFYSIGSSGHEGMAALGAVTRNTDMAFLHYRDAAFVIERKRRLPGATTIWDMALSFAASREDPVSGGRHKVLGGKDIFVPPQTSTIASHLPKAVGAAHSISLNRRQKNPYAELPDDAVILCSFGDASANHSTAQGAFNAAGWTAWQNLPMPIVFICEDNNIGISVRTPKGWIEAGFAARPGLAYRQCQGLDLCDITRGLRDAVSYARARRRPVFMHINMVRLMGHAGADIEAAYTDIDVIEKAEAQDPLLHSARIILENNLMQPEQIISLYEQIGAQVTHCGQLACDRPKLETASQVMEAIIPPKTGRKMPDLPPEEKRQDVLRKELRQKDQPQPMARHINMALADLMLQNPQIMIFGEDVGRKGGVYSVTTGLQKKFGPTRVIDTLLDEQSILGLAIGAAQNGLLPIAEIQFLAYLHNAEDQLRGEAATLSFFSDGQYTNPMVVRIAGLGYQKGFGGHFHNDNSLNVLRDIPGIIVACPSTGADAAAMLREAVRLAYEEGRVVIFIEPIALYMTQDLLQKDDGKWAAAYAAPANAAPIAYGEMGITQKGRAKNKDLVIFTYGNGHFLSQQAREEIEENGISTRIIDMRWLHPLPQEAIVTQARRAKNILIVDECRETGSISEQMVTILTEGGITAPIARVTSTDSFIPLGKAAKATLPSRENIVTAALELCEKGDKK